MGNGKLLNVALMGAGTMGRIHADSIEKSKIAKVTGVFACDETSQQLAESIGAKAVENPAKLISDPDIDVVVIACPTDVHAEYMRLAHAAGKHIFCEKPTVRTVQEADEISKLFRKYNKVVSVGHVLRFAPIYQQLRETVQSTLGDVGTIRFGRCAAFPRGRDGWFADFQRSGGVILDLMLHDLDMLRWCFGEIDRIYTMRTKPKKDAMRDYALIVARMKSGAIAHLEGSWAEPTGTFYYYYEATGSNGLIEFDSRVEPTLTVHPKVATETGLPGVIVPQSPSAVSPYELEMWSFLECIQNGENPVVSLEDGLAAIRIANAAMQSAEEDRPVSVRM